MTVTQALLTIAGGFLLPFVILLLWGRLVERFGVKGGWLAALLIIGPMWLLNHGLPSPLIFQNGPVFIDMGLAAGMGLLVSGLASGNKLASYRLTLPAAILGGILAGFLLSFL